MATISVLNPQIANMIAAGEVVERPSSVIKELLENSIDAGAKAITVEIRDGGITHMRVTDDGRGMDEDDAATAFLRHATSKIKYENDLTSIRTLGFRGEALAAIAAVSHIELFTKPAPASFGTHIALEAGEILDKSETGCPDGTTIIVKDLFFNTPARMKFLKKDSTEASYVITSVERTALSHPEIRFKLIRDGKDVLNTPGDGNLSSVIYAIYGREFSQKFRALAGVQRNIEVSGYTADTTFVRSNRGMENFFINGRFVQSKLLMAAVEQAYSGKLMHGKFPACFLNITISPSLVDINVHPAKLEVKFAHEREVFSVIYQFILSAIEGNNMADDDDDIAVEVPKKPIKPLDKSLFLYNESEKSTQSNVAQTASIPYQTRMSQGGVYTPNATTQKMQDAPSYERKGPFLEIGGYQSASGITTASGTVYKTNATDSASNAEFGYKTAQEAKEYIEPASEINAEPTGEQEQKNTESHEITATAQTQEKVHFRLIGEVFSTYILVELDGEFLMIDKHAGHERMIYNKLCNTTDGTSAQTLLAAETVTVNRREKDVILEHLDEMERAGFDIDDFGGSAVVVRAIPMYVKSISITEIITDIAQKLLDMRSSKADFYDEILKSVACKAAVKAGYFTDAREMQEFAESVLSDPKVRNCPHGRPVIVTMTQKDIEKLFKRIV